MYKAIVVIGIATAAWLAASCGNSEDITESAASATKPQFIKQAKAICSDTRDRMKAAVAVQKQENGKELNFNQVIEQVLAPALQREAEDLESLTPPEKDAAQIHRMVANLANGAADYVKGNGNPHAASEIRTFQDEADEYGLGACRL